MAVRGPDRVGEPDAGIAGPYRRGPQPVAEARECGRDGERDVRLGPESRAPAESPGANQRTIVVSRDDHDLAIWSGRATDRAKHRLGHLHRPACTAFLRLDDVAQQHQPSDAPPGREPPPETART